MSQNLKIEKDKYALTDEDLSIFCTKHSLPYHLIKDLEDLKINKKAQAFVFTGEEKDEKNGSNNKHWLFKIGNHIFDSYGDPKAYDLPEYSFLNNDRLQAWGTNVCGCYCLAFCWYINKETTDVENLQQNFEEYFELTKNHIENDKNIRKWYDEESK